MKAYTTTFEPARLRLQGRDWLHNLAVIVNRRPQERAQREAEWYRAIPEAKMLADFYTRIAGAKLGAGQFLLELGWKTGWESKTFGSRLLDNEAFMERVIITGWPKAGASAATRFRRAGVW